MSCDRLQGRSFDFQQKVASTSTRSADTAPGGAPSSLSKSEFDFHLRNHGHRRILYAVKVRNLEVVALYLRIGSAKGRAAFYVDADFARRSFIMKSKALRSLVE